MHVECGHESKWFLSGREVHEELSFRQPARGHDGTLRRQEKAYAITISIIMSPLIDSNGKDIPTPHRVIREIITVTKECERRLCRVDISPRQQSISESCRDWVISRKNW